MDDLHEELFGAVVGALLGAMVSVGCLGATIALRQLILTIYPDSAHATALGGSSCKSTFTLKMRNALYCQRRFFI